MCPLLVAELLSILWPFLPAEPIFTCEPAHQAASLPHASVHRPCRVLSPLWMAWLSPAAFPGTEAKSLGEGVHDGVGHSERTTGIWGGVWDSFHACHKIFSHVVEGLSLLWPSAVAREAREHQGDWGIWVPADLGIYPLLSLSCLPQEVLSSHGYLKRC